MGGVRVSRLRRVSALLWARLGYAASCLTAAVGVGMEFGLGWGLTVGGVVGAASCLLLVDVDGKGPARGGEER